MNITTVTELNNYLKRSFDSNELLSDIWIKGEISNFKLHFSGHMYFTLKDNNSSLKCVMFKSYASYMRFVPSDGMKVVCHGRVSVFERDGSYQLYPDSMISDGVGDLYIAYEKLKTKLQIEGLFDQSHKKDLPEFPKRVGVVTSPTGAAVRDIINVITRRCKNTDILIFPVQVQGEGAKESIAGMINKINELSACDVMIVGRGGGSIEDLWAFNEEIVARAIYQSNIPIISAIGHETDFTIADFVSDMRAPTPSAAAELAVKDSDEVINLIRSLTQSIHLITNNKLKTARHSLEMIISTAVFKDKLAFISSRRDYINQCINKITDISIRKKEAASFEFVNILSKLEALNPLSVMKRGFSVIEREGKMISDSKSLKCGDEIDIRFHDGVRNAKIID